MIIEFIGLTTHRQGGDPRQTSLALTDREPGHLRVIGVLPHGQMIRPETAADRDHLVAWLQTLEYQEEGLS